MLGIALGLAYSNAAEWLIHKHVLHGLGKNKNSFWSFHWGEHHRACRRNDFRDPDYERNPFGWHAQGKEIFAVAGLLAAHAPLWGVAPWFTASVWYSGLNYLYKHRKSHLEPEWGKKHLRHHYDHHMGKNQDANWCVTRPWADWVMGTRIEYDYETPKRSKRRAPPQSGEVPMVQVPLAADLDNTQVPSSDEDAA